VGAAYFLRHKILGTFKEFDEESIFRFMVLLMITTSKLEKAMQALYLSLSSARKFPDSLAPVEHIALTLIMNKSILLWDVGNPY
jgi:hypothetical protein